VLRSAVESSYDYATDAAILFSSPLPSSSSSFPSSFSLPPFHSGPPLPPARLSRRAVKNRSCHGHRRHFKKLSGAREGERANGRETNGRISASANERARDLDWWRLLETAFRPLRSLSLPIHLFLERPPSVAARSVRTAPSVPVYNRCSGLRALSRKKLTNHSRLFSSHSTVIGAFHLVTQVDTRGEFVYAVTAAEGIILSSLFIGRKQR